MLYSLNLNNSSCGVVTFATSLTCSDDVIISWPREISKNNNSMPISHAFTKFEHQGAVALEINLTLTADNMILSSCT